MKLTDTSDVLERPARNAVMGTVKTILLEFLCYGNGAPKCRSSLALEQ